MDKTIAPKKNDNGVNVEQKAKDTSAQTAQTPTTESHALGLDIGTSRLVLAKESTTHSQLNAFLAVPFTKVAEDILQQREIAFDRNCKDLYVYGNDTDFFVSFLNVNPRRPMQSGVLNSKEKLSQHIIKRIIEKMAPTTLKGETIGFSVPGKGADTGANLVYHEAVIKGLLQSLGYKAKAVNEGSAVVFSELQSENFTGIGISFGGGMCNVCVSFMSMPIITFSIPKGGDYIDRCVGDVVNETATRVRLLKEETLDLSVKPKNEITSAFHIYYEDMLQTLIEKLRAELEGSQHLPTLDRPIPIILSGGTAMPNGFQQKFEEKLNANDFPIKISDIRMAKNPLAATAIGCYVAAMSEGK